MVGVVKEGDSLHGHDFFCRISRAGIFPHVKVFHGISGEYIGRNA
jgi:hypothetical protein